MNNSPANSPQETHHSPANSLQATYHSLAESLIDQLQARGIEARMQRTFFDDEVAVHVYGNDSPAIIYSLDHFIRWAIDFLSSHESL